MSQDRFIDATFGSVSSGGSLVKTRKAKTLYSTPLTGATVTVTSDVSRVMVVPADDIAALTIALPGSPEDGQEIIIYFVKAVATLTTSGGSAATGFSFSAAATVGQVNLLTYSSTAAKWFNIVISPVEEEG